MILERLRRYIVATQISGPHRARYPSPEWNVKSWSYRLVQDLLLRQALHRWQLDRFPLVDRVSASAFSYHHDAAYKALLFSALQRTGKDRILVLPEVGPFGFDLLIARCAGFTRFVAYDKDAETVDACRGFHRNVDVEYSVSSSATFDLSGFSSATHLVVFPDWPHDDLAQRLTSFENVLRYSFRSEGATLEEAQRRLGLARIDWSGLFQAIDRL